MGALKVRGLGLDCGFFKASLRGLSEGCYMRALKNIAVKNTYAE